MTGFIVDWLVLTGYDVDAVSFDVLYKVCLMPIHPLFAVLPRKIFLKNHIGLTTTLRSILL